jgi:hypothetical protein
VSPASHHHERTRRRRDAPARRSRGALRRTGQAPDHLAVPDREAFDELGGHGRIDELVGGGASAEAVDGLTNRDLYDRFGFAVKGRPVPDSAVEDDTKLDRLVVMPTRTRPVRYGEPSDTRA